ncbi:hypothetical protein EN904_13430 [Mesorhizobium sp. M7A.F.Ca.CA.001.07.2.1]|uniref:hypothetical protein n=1 Tax=Mesorhizobium TaxID=68287 RepID=UPI000FCAA148|nr:MULTISPECIES: hypothetical protein [Mesorhizobium]RVB21335.1 hypothetical protein EN918_30545 [Mesorhizobium sp. M7A.F.Ca.CA.004.05.1.1]MCF6124390.1 hypothetical protein [Mesorhizobium ciceri]MCQ8816649.1 hypothetical protein [Mesorhizobium sp. SEMIA396]RUX82449.1 hypothetical protein EN983_01045 [Mesorhizobium sp. M7A.F.Ca.CA.004.08.2.1]RUX87212.1 hypothetical protein EN982_11710 [Mesorhizobium sp. M7A.F.Ca.CA.004.08.1.1]
MAFATAFQGNAFQANAFQIVPPETDTRQPGAGHYRRRPTIYLDRHGKPVDIHARKVEPLESEILPELTPAMVEALMAKMHVPQLPQADPMASIMAKMGQLMISRELDAMVDDDTLMVLLLS